MNQQVRLQPKPVVSLPHPTSTYFATLCHDAAAADVGQEGGEEEVSIKGWEEERESYWLTMSTAKRCLVNWGLRLRMSGNILSNRFREWQCLTKGMWVRQCNYGTIRVTQEFSGHTYTQKHRALTFSSSSRWTFLWTSEISISTTPATQREQERDKERCRV